MEQISYLKSWAQSGGVFSSLQRVEGKAGLAIIPRLAVSCTFLLIVSRSDGSHVRL